ncbi:MAG: hypothetical protein Q7J98_13625 [Kiritimatiellia bacterium]|nr:hypothetical protein [Kiritimatiellia bacterium]
MIDKIDLVLAKHYGFPASGGSACGGTDPASSRPLECRDYAAASEELDFIINYDIKYRTCLAGAPEQRQMGLDGEEETDVKRTNNVET